MNLETTAAAALGAGKAHHALWLLLRLLLFDLAASPPMSQQLPMRGRQGVSLERLLRPVCRHLLVS